MTGDRFTEQYRQLSADPAARAALLADPKEALRAYFGRIVDGDYRVEVIEQRSDTITALVPCAPRDDADPSDRLLQVSGRVFDLLHSTGVGGFIVPDAQLMWVLRDMRALWADEATPSATALQHEPATGAEGVTP